jgi:Ca2+-binding EF-hand superfamily protein
MGNRQKGRETQSWELDAISNLVGIPRQQLENIYKDFRRVSKDYLLDKYEFRRIYKDLIRYSSHPQDYSDLSIYELNRQNNATADRIFKTFNNDNTGRLTFDEFISAYIMLQNSISPQIRLNFLLDHYSQNNGYITPTMGRRVIQDMSDLYGVNTDYQQVWGNLEANYALQNGRIPQQAFTDYFINHPAYSAAFYNGVQIPLPPPSPQF